MPGLIRRICLHTSNPFMPGKTTSRMTMSYSFWCNLRIPASPSKATSTVNICSSRPFFMKPLTFFSSSIISTLICHFHKRMPLIFLHFFQYRRPDWLQPLQFYSTWTSLPIRSGPEDWKQVAPCRAHPLLSPTSLFKNNRPVYQRFIIYDLFPQNILENNKKWDHLLTETLTKCFATRNNRRPKR